MSSKSKFKKHELLLIVQTTFQKSKWNVIFLMSANTSEYGMLIK
jgi:hypothetical protein